LARVRASILQMACAITGVMAMLRQLTAASLPENGLDGLEFNEFAMPVF
jgi:hypothetical protein